MFSGTGPVISKPSACLGEATNWIPNRPRSHPTVPRTLVSASQALQPPALTCRSLSERPKRRCRRTSRGGAGLKGAGVNQQIVASAGRHPVIGGESNVLRSANRGAFRAEETPPQVQAQAVLLGNGASRAGLDASSAARRAVPPSDDRPSHKTRGQDGGRTCRELHRPVFLLYPSQENIEHRRMYLFQAVSEAGRRRIYLPAQPHRS